MTLDAEIIYFLLREGDGLAACADEAGCAADVVDKMPAIIGQHHLAQNIAREHLALDGLFTAVGDLGHGFHGDVDLLDQILHPAVLGSLHDRCRNCVFITGIGMDHIPSCVLCHGH